MSPKTTDCLSKTQAVTFGDPARIPIRNLVSSIVTVRELHLLQPERPSPYVGVDSTRPSSDRLHVQDQSLGLHLPYSELASNLCVDVSIVKRTVKLFNQTGSVSKKVYDKSGLPRKLTETVKYYIIRFILQHPGIYLREIVAEILAVELSESAICGVLCSHGFKNADDCSTKG